MDWLLRPTHPSHRLCTIRDLQDGTYDLADVALMNDILDADAENEGRARLAAKQKR